MQRCVLAGVRVQDFFPDVHDLPEGLTRDGFQTEYGGLGGDGTRRFVADILARLEKCAALR